MIAEVFLRTAAVAEALLRRDRLVTMWDEPSALDGYTVAGLSGHLARAVFTTRSYLSAPEPAAGVTFTDPAGYFLALLGDHHPVHSDAHRAVRERGAADAAEGAERLADAFTEDRRRLEGLLDGLDPSRGVEVRDGLALTAGDYLRTRLLELVVHGDDLAVSIGRAGPVDVPAEAYRITAGLLGEIAAAREGGPATVRSLARRERHPGAVRAF